MIAPRSRSLRRLGATTALVLAVSAIGIAAAAPADASSKVHVYTGKGYKAFAIHRPSGNAPYLATISFAKKTKGNWYLQSVDSKGEIVTSTSTQNAPWTGTVLMDPPANHGSGTKLKMATQSTLYNDKWKIVLKPVSSAPVLHAGETVSGHFGAVYRWNGPATNVTVSWKGTKFTSLDVTYYTASNDPTAERYGWVVDGAVAGTPATGAIPAGPLWIEVAGSQTGKGTWTVSAAG